MFPRCAFPEGPPFFSLDFSHHSREHGDDPAPLGSPVVGKLGRSSSSSCPERRQDVGMGRGEVGGKAGRGEQRRADWLAGAEGAAVRSGS